MKRFNLKLTKEEHEGLKKAAKTHNTSMTNMLRIYLRIGLNGEKPGTDIIIKEQGRIGKYVYIA
jgi:hypothetical protein